MTKRDCMQPGDSGACETSSQTGGALGYWSATTYATTSPQTAGYVRFGDGYVLYDGLYSYLCVRAVR